MKVTTTIKRERPGLYSWRVVCSGEIIAVVSGSATWQRQARAKAAAIADALTKTAT